MKTSQASKHNSGDLDEAYGDGGIVNFKMQFVFEDFDDNLLWLDEQDRALFMYKISTPDASQTLPVLQRLLANGRPDLAFGSEGRVVIGREIIPAETSRYNVLRRPDGRILAVCSTHSKNIFEIYAVQFLANGDLDRDFGIQGVQNIGAYTSVIYAISLQADGKVLLAGENSRQGMVIRLTQAGELDGTWGNQGVQLHHFDRGDLVFWKVGSGPDGRVLLLGNDTKAALGMPNGFVIVRLLSDGTLDPGFGGDGTGFMREVFESSDKGIHFEQFVIQADNKLFVSLSINQAQTHQDLWKGRYTEQGVFDQSYNGGRPKYDFLGGGETGSGLKTRILADNKVLMAGYRNRVLANDIMAVYRYLADGGEPSGNGRDATFGNDGVVTLNRWPDSFAQAYGLAIQSDGKYLVLGSRRPDGGSLFRLLP